MTGAFFAAFDRGPPSPPPSELRRAFAANLRRERLAARLSPVELSVLAALPRDHVAACEDAAGGDVPLDAVVALAAALRVSLAELLQPAPLPAPVGREVML